MTKTTLAALILFTLAINAEAFPTGQWLSNDSDPIWAEPNAPKGGIFRGYIHEFPPTFRIWGPYAHHPSRGLFSDNQLSLVAFHPNTGNPIPSLATEWYFHKDSSAISFRIHPDARWSDSTPVTAEDFVFTQMFFTSGMAKDEWFKSFYLNNIESVKAIDKKTVYIQSTSPLDHRELIKRLNLRPLPKHFYTVPVENLIKVSQWRVEPNTGPYILSGYTFGDELIFRRKTEWWGKNLKYNRGRFNVDTVIYKTYTSREDIRKAFSNGFIDYYKSTSSYEHTPLFKPLIESGAVHHFIFNHHRNPVFNGILINTQSNILKEKAVRQALFKGLKIEKPDKQYREITALLDQSGDLIREHNPFKAKRVLTNAGWLAAPDELVRKKENKGLSLELVYDSRISEDVVAELSESAIDIGIELNTYPLTPTQLQTYMVNKVFDLALFAFDKSYFGYKDLFNHKKMAEPDNWAFYSNKQHQSKEAPRDYENYIASEYLAIPGHVSNFSFGYHWRWLIFPKTPSTNASSNIYEPFAQGGLFWINREFLIETRTHRRQNFQFEKVIQVFE